MAENPPPRQSGNPQPTSGPSAKSSKNPPMRNSDESGSDISNTRSLNAEGSGFDADGELSDITVPERKKRHRKIVRNISTTKKKRSPNQNKIVQKKDESDSGNKSK